MHIDPVAYAARQPRVQKANRVSGILLALIMLTALGLAGRRIWTVASGPLPPGPGAQAPALAAVTPDGQRLDLAGYQGQVVLVDFWATWCPPCRAAMPALQEFHTQYTDQGFAVLGVNQEPSQGDWVSQYMRQRGLTFPTLLDPGALARNWGVFTFPTSFLVDRDGKVVRVYRGLVAKDVLRKDIESTLSPDS